MGYMVNNCVYSCQTIWKNYKNSNVLWPIFTSYPTWSIQCASTAVPRLGQAVRAEEDVYTQGRQFPNKVPYCKSWKLSLNFQRSHTVLGRQKGFRGIRIGGGRWE